MEKWANMIERDVAMEKISSDKRVESVENIWKDDESNRARKSSLKRSKSTGHLHKDRIDYSSDDNDSFDVSLEDLIKNTVCSAKALQPLPVSKAKER